MGDIYGILLYKDYVKMILTEAGSEAAWNKIFVYL